MHSDERDYLKAEVRLARQLLLLAQMQREALGGPEGDLVQRVSGMMEERQILLEEIRRLTEERFKRFPRGVPGGDRLLKERDATLSTLLTVDRQVQEELQRRSVALAGKMEALWRSEQGQSAYLEKLLPPSVTLLDKRF